MPHERREIRLFEDELLQAIEVYGRQTPGVLPTGPLLGVSVAGKAPEPPVVTVTVRCAADPSGSPVEIVLNDESVFEVLVRFCLEEGIPIPRGGKKTTSVIDGLLALVINYGDSPKLRSH